MKATFDITGMTCAACKPRVEKATAKVDGVELCYWLEEIHGHLQPVWAFSGTAVMPDQSTVTFDAYVPALEA